MRRSVITQTSFFCLDSDKENSKMLSMNFLRFLSLNIAQIYLEFSSKYEIGGYLMGKTNRFFSYCSDFNEYGKDYFWSKKDDTGKSRYYFKIDDTLIEVSYEVYMFCMKS